MARKPRATVASSSKIPKQGETSKAVPYKSLRNHQDDPAASKVPAAQSRRLAEVPTSLATVEVISEAESVVRVMARMRMPAASSSTRTAAALGSG
jgi:hypothetical protein